MQYDVYFFGLEFTLKPIAFSLPIGKNGWDVYWYGIIIAVGFLSAILYALKNAKTFKVSAKRSDKKFAMTSPEISRELGGRILSKYHHLKVDVNNPEVNVMVEIRD